MFIFYHEYESYPQLNQVLLCNYISLLFVFSRRVIWFFHLGNCEFHNSTPNSAAGHPCLLSRGSDTSVFLVIITKHLSQSPPTHFSLDWLLSTTGARLASCISLPHHLRLPFPILSWPSEFQQLLPSYRFTPWFWWSTSSSSFQKTVHRKEILQTLTMWALFFHIWCFIF